MDAMEQRLRKALEKRKQEDSFRSLRINEGWIDFSSNDYLGLSRNRALFEQIERAFLSLNIPNKLGATGSRLISGHSSAISELEEFLASIHHSESALLFNSGYMACFGVLSTIPQKGDTIFYDELSHACIKDGARLSLAEKFSFRHNDLADLERKFSLAKGNSFVVVESIYSMDGDASPLQELVLLVKKYGASLIVDEAHSTGVYGIRGAGLAVELGVENEIFIRIYTFGKAMGVHGACVASSNIVKDYLINFCRPFIYTTALSPHSVVSIYQAYDYLQVHSEVQNDLNERIQLFLTHIRPDLISIPSSSPIQAVVIPGNSRVRGIANTLQNKGFDIRPILSPTVPVGKERLRISLHAHNTNDEVLGMVSVLNDLI